MSGIKNKRIKIIFLVDFFRTINAGTECQLGYLLIHLPKMGFDVQLISFQESPFLRNEILSVFPDITVKKLGAQSDISKSLPSLYRLLKILRKNKPDIVHTFFTASNSFGVLVARFAGVRTIISSRRDMGFNLTKKDIFILKIANRFVSYIIANSSAVQEKTIRLEGLSRQKIQVIYNGIELSKIKKCLSEVAKKDPTIGIVSNLNRSVKRVDLFIRVAALVHKKNPHVKYWIIGDGPLRSILEDLALRLGLSTSLSFLGSQNDVQGFLKKMDIGVITSDSEGLSNAIMEYMKAGLPVIATNVGGNPEIVLHGKTGLLVPPDNPEKLAESINKLIIETERAQHMGKAGRELLEKQFCIEIMINKTATLYKSLLF